MMAKKDKAKKGKGKVAKPAPVAAPPPVRRVFASREDAADLPAEVKARRDGGAIWRDIAIALNLGPGKTGTSRARRLYRDANAGKPAPRKVRKERGLRVRSAPVERVAHVPFKLDDTEEEILRHIQGRKVCWQSTRPDDTGREPLRVEDEGVVGTTASVDGGELEDGRTLHFVEPLFGFRAVRLADVYAVRELTAAEHLEIGKVWEEMGKLWPFLPSGVALPKREDSDKPTKRARSRRAKVGV